jgi:small subunit ribosomal protein S3
MMLYQEKLIEEPFAKYQVMKYLEKRLDRAGLASVDIQRTPLVTRITLEVANPARIIGKKGRLINELTADIKSEFNIENPQISVIEVRNQFLEPRMVGKRATKYIEMGKKVRAVLHYMLREIIRAGALGAEIVAAGKIGAKGARAKSLRVSAGYIPKAGEPCRQIKVAHINANTRSGVIGILVRIVPPGTVFPDKKSTQEVVLPKVIAAATGVGNRAGADGAQGSTGKPRSTGPKRNYGNRGGGNRGGPRGGYGGGPRGGPRGGSGGGNRGGRR